MHNSVLRVAVTAGEPAGIGPDVVIALAEHDWPAELVMIADPELIKQRAARLGMPIQLSSYDAAASPIASRRGRLTIAAEPLRADCVAGQPVPGNADYVLATLARACDGCLNGEFAAMATAPVHKGVINDAGIPFSGHTEYLAERTRAPRPVMLLVAGTLRVALVTTHLALRDVPAAITGARIRQTFELLHAGLVSRFGIATPRIVVLGLNPHAGETGYLGNEETEIITPALTELRTAGYEPIGPLPADTAFAPHLLSDTDAVLAMYHDQGLPVLKNHGFGRAVNVTLGLPIIRTSADHGTAAELAATGRADAGSMRAALTLAIDMAKRIAG